jgi:hypothetical protein
MRDSSTVITGIQPIRFIKWHPKLELHEQTAYSDSRKQEMAPKSIHYGHNAHEKLNRSPPHLSENRVKHEAEIAGPK